METHLEVDEKNKLVEVRETKSKQIHYLCVLPLKLFLTFFIPYLSRFTFPGLIVKTQSYLFGSSTEWEKAIFITRFGVMYILSSL